MTFASLTGRRIPSEVLPLEGGQIDRKAKTIRFEPGATKNNKGRTLHYDLLPELEDVVATAWQEHELLAAEGVLCPNVFHRSGRPIKSLRDSWESACETAGVPGKIPHDFRRTAARNLIRAGVSEVVAMQVTGHLSRRPFFGATTSRRTRM